ncbi:uncharacterized protein TRIVIDRAFT_213159 [Trichoderma virens Gv29-8]|uniref:Uncharacterized protein n=1 Tax=Hypocrea virens (strain Gv29-8 / FGSC 10586) TaxID=413071 RepID=G9MVX5_HYPVG|nr:uncharacterized protein TRIVIDRAFT_213159 [Trichoderma virens Gv29-8]EHK21448.1 hypothetical protein TRIVIDRAFT_213159 [Trichoderma virens Gv29-8]
MRRNGGTALFIVPVPLPLFLSLSLFFCVFLCFCCFQSPFKFSKHLQPWRWSNSAPLDRRITMQRPPPEMMYTGAVPRRGGVWGNPGLRSGDDSQQMAPVVGVSLADGNLVEATG